MFGVLHRYSFRVAVLPLARKQNWSGVLLATISRSESEFSPWMNKVTRLTLTGLERAKAALATKQYP